MSLHHGCNAYIYIAFAAHGSIGFARAEEDWENVLEEDEEYLEEHPDALPLSLEGYVINTETGTARDLDLGWVCGYTFALEALEQELQPSAWYELSPSAFDALCERFEVGAYEPLR